LRVSGILSTEALATYLTEQHYEHDQHYE